MVSSPSLIWPKKIWDAEDGIPTMLPATLTDLGPRKRRQEFNDFALVQPSLRDGIPRGVVGPWTDVYGYHQAPLARWTFKRSNNFLCCPFYLEGSR